MEYILTFRNTNFAIKAEQCLLAQTLHVSVLPLPSQIRAGCGICLRIQPDEIRPALKALAQSNIDEIDLYSRETENEKMIYTKVESIL